MEPSDPLQQTSFPLPRTEERELEHPPADSEPPEVRLGELMAGGLAPAILAIVERGVQRRPAEARALRAEIELSIEDGYPPVRIVFGRGADQADATAADRHSDLRVGWHSSDRAVAPRH